MSEPLVEARAEERKAEKPARPKYVRKSAVKNPVTTRIAEIKRDLHILSQLLDLAAKDPSTSKAFLLFWDDLSLQVEEIRKLTTKK
jgi:predicted AAA+ superfamily ATPase